MFKSLYIVLASVLVKQFLTLWDKEKVALPILVSFSLQKSLMKIEFLAGHPQMLLMSLNAPLAILPLRRGRQELI